MERANLHDSTNYYSSLVGHNGLSKKIIEKIPKHHFKFDENGIYEEFINLETDEVSYKQSIPFSSMNRILIGNLVEEKEKNYKYFSKKYYEFSAMMVIEHEDGRSLHSFDHKEEFENWLPRFLDKDCTVVKTEFDLAPARIEAIMEERSLNFSEITGKPWKADTSHLRLENNAKKSLCPVGTVCIE